MTPSPHFLKKLHSYDPDLRVVWSYTKECWLVERKVRRGRPSTYVDSPDPDVVRRTRDGYIHVGNVPPRELNELVLLNLWKSDMWRQGGAKVVNHEIDRFYEEQDARDSRTQRDDLKQVAAEMWDSLAWRRGSKIRVPEMVNA